MAIPVVVGYGFARRATRAHGAARFTERLAAIDPTDLWLAASAGLMTVGLLGSLSRGGILGGAAGAAAFVWLSGARSSKRQRIGGVVSAVGGLIALAPL